VNVLSITDQLRDHVFTFAARANGTGLAVVDAGHCVIQVRQVGRARIEYRRRFLIGAVGVRDGDGAELGRFFGKFHRTGQLCCHVRDTDEPFGSVIKLLERRKIRISQIRAVLRALFLLGEERSLHLDAHEMGTALRLRLFKLHSRFVRRLQHVVGQRHGRGREARHAVLCEIARHFDKSVIVAV